MSLIHRVIILNQPTKFSLMGLPRFTIWQWVMLLLSLCLAIFAFTQVPKDWKVGFNHEIPVGFLVGLLIFCGASVWIHASELRPGQWWRNFFLYNLGMVPKVYYPHIEEIDIPYPDPELIEEVEREEEGYIEIDMG